MEQRIKQLQELLDKNTLNAVLISSYESILYLTDYAGFIKGERDAYVFITKNNAYLLTNPLYSEQTTTYIPHFTTLERNQEISYAKHLETIIIKEKITTVGFESDNLTVDEYQYFKKILPHLKSIDLFHIREIKNEHEVMKIKNACVIAKQAYAYLLHKIKVDVTEKQLVYELEQEMRRLGAEPAFATIVTFGKNSSIPHHLSGDQKLKSNDTILIDFGARKNNYCSDISRTLFFGKPTTEEIKMYEVVKKAQEKAVEYIASTLSHQGIGKSIVASDVDQVARQYIVSQGYPAFPHSLGHGIGIAVHETPILSPRSKDILQNGAVFSLEPGIYLPGQMGIRIEDLYTIQDNKLIQLTKAPERFVL